jgi:serine/threonine protein phosphatase 1
MYRIFAISDMHSYLTPTLEALKNAGWDEDNPQHKIIVCGDALDRGNETVKMLEWLLDLINKDKLIYIKGNHDILMQQMLNRGYSEWHDKHNGTEKSYYQLLNAHTNMMNGRKPDEIVREVLQPLYDKMVNYFETKRFVFCHSWVAIGIEDNMPYHYRKGRRLVKKEDWRNGTDEEWNNAMWVNPLDMAMDGFGIDKPIIAGHWHASAGWAWKNKVFDEFGEDAIFDPFYYEDKLIMIDRCVAHTGKINCLVIEDEFLDG